MIFEIGMKMNDCSISIVLPVFNAEKTIEKTLESILLQAYTEFEVFVIDDCSTDMTVAQIEKIADKRVKLIKNEQNKGAAYSRNKAIERSRSRFVAFVDSDDAWLPDKLQKQVKFMTENNCAISCTAYSRYVEDSFEKNVVPPSHITRKMMLASNYIALPTSMVDFSMTGERYFRQLRAKEDYLFWLDLLREGFSAMGMPDVLCKYAVNKNIHHRKRLAKKQWDLYRNVEKMNYWDSLRFFSMYAFHGLKKNYF